MASIGVLGSLMSQLGTMTVPQYDPQQVALMQQRLQGGRMGNETALLQLQDLKRQQEAQAALYQQIQQNPDILLGGGGMPQSTLGGLQAGGAGAITQSPMPGMPGQTQTVPAYPDASRYAGVSPQGGGPIQPDVAGQVMPTVTPPQSTLGALGPQPRPDPVRALLQENPQAGLQLLDMQAKRQEQQFKMRGTVAEGIAVELQGATDQASYDAARQRVAQISPQWAQALPQVYSKEAVQPWIDRAIGAKDKAQLDATNLNTQVEAAKVELAARQQAAGVPKYTEDSTLNVAIDRRMQQAGIPRGTPPPEAILTQAQEDVEAGKVRVSASQGTGQIVKGPTGEYIRVKPGTNQIEVIRGPGGEPLREKPSETEQKGATLANSVAAANTLATELEDKGYKPSVWEKGLDKLPLGLGNYLTSSDYQKYRQTVREFASAWLYGVSGAQITDSEWENANQTFFPQPNEDKGAVELKRQRRAALVDQLRQQTQATGRTGTQGQPTSQAPSGGATRQAPQAPLKPVGQMSRDELLAERDRLRQGGR